MSGNCAIYSNKFAHIVLYKGNEQTCRAAKGILRSVLDMHAPWGSDVSVVESTTSSHSYTMVTGFKLNFDPWRLNELE